MINKEIEKLLSCDKCNLKECIGCDITYTDRKAIREYIEHLENKIKELGKGQHTLEKIIYDYMNGELITKNEKISFSNTENEIMRLLVKNKNKFTDRKIITEAIYGVDWEPYCDSNISVFISRLRKKLKGILIIDTKFGYGYRIRKNK